MEDFVDLPPADEESALDNPGQEESDRLVAIGEAIVVSECLVSSPEEAERLIGVGRQVVDDYEASVRASDEP